MVGILGVASMVGAGTDKYHIISFRITRQLVLEEPQEQA